jgi:hypothetical protein
VILVPVDMTRETTYEDPSVTRPEDRIKHFWQADHVRLYGQDAAQRLAQPGFHIEIDRYLYTVPQEVITRHGAASPGMYVLRRNEQP